MKNVKWIRIKPSFWVMKPRDAKIPGILATIHHDKEHGWYFLEEGTTNRHDHLPSLEVAMTLMPDAWIEAKLIMMVAKAKQSKCTKEN